MKKFLVKGKVVIRTPGVELPSTSESTLYGDFLNYVRSNIDNIEDIELESIDYEDLDSNEHEYIVALTGLFNNTEIKKDLDSNEHEYIVALTDLFNNTTEIKKVFAKDKVSAGLLVVNSKIEEAYKIKEEHFGWTLDGLKKHMFNMDNIIEVVEA